MVHTYMCILLWGNHALGLIRLYQFCVTVFLCSGQTRKCDEIVWIILIQITEIVTRTMIVTGWKGHDSRLRKWTEKEELRNWKLYYGLFIKHSYLCSLDVEIIGSIRLCLWQFRNVRLPRSGVATIPFGRYTYHNLFLQENSHQCGLLVGLDSELKLKLPK